MKSFPRSIPISGRVRVCMEYLKAEKLKGKNLLDVGSTFGWLAKELKTSNLKKYMGVEPNVDALSFSKNTVKGSNILFKEGNAAQIPYTSSSADVAVFFDVIEHVPANTEIECLKEINRVLKKGGVLLLSTPYDHLFTKLLDPAYYFGHRHYSQKRLSYLLEKSGFTLDTFEVRGGLISLIYMDVFYIMKWIFKKDLNGTSLQKLDDQSYFKRGIATVYLRARKK